MIADVLFIWYLEASHERQFNVIVHSDRGSRNAALLPGSRHQGPHGPRQVPMSGHRLVPVEEGGEEGLPVLGWHDVVDDWVDCRIKIEKYPRDIKQFLINGVIYFIRHPVQPDEKSKLFYKSLQISN